MHIPEATGGTGDDGKPVKGPLADHAIIAFSDGSILAGMFASLTNAFGLRLRK